MAGDDAAIAYRQASACGSSPVGLIVALYDILLRDFRRALDALERGKVQARVTALNHSLAVVGHLEEVLDHKRGGEAAKNFQRLYQVTRGMIVDANAQSSRKSINGLIEMYTSLRQAWHVVDQKLRAGEPQAAAPVTMNIPSRAPVPPKASEAADQPRKNWSA